MCLSHFLLLLLKIWWPTHQIYPQFNLICDRIKILLRLKYRVLRIILCSFYGCYICVSVFMYPPKLIYRHLIAIAHKTLESMDTNRRNVEFLSFVFFFCFLFWNTASVCTYIDRPMSDACKFLLFWLLKLNSRVWASSIT